jgi:hypothetical protein
MIEHDEDDQPSDELLKLAELAEQVTQRIQAGEPENGDGGIAINPDSVSPIRELLPTLRAMISAGEPIAGEQRLNGRTQRKKTRQSS